MKPKLLILTTTFPRWKNDPDPPFVYELARRLTSDFEITVHTPHYSDSKTKEEMEQIKVHRFRYFAEPVEKLAGSSGILPTLRNNKLYYAVLPFFLAAQFISSLLLVRKIRPDVIHAHWVFPQGLWGIILKSIFKIPVVVTAHGADVFGLKHPLFRILKRFVLIRATKVTAVSSSLKAKIIQEIHPIPVRVVPMGVCAQTFSPDKQVDHIREQYDIEDKFILYVGRLSEKKGVRYLIDAMPQVMEKFPATKLLIVGSGELKQELQRHVESQGLDDHIIFVGGLPNDQLAAYYACCDVFVGPSVQARGGDTEGFGLTFVEAAMSGCLLIGCDVGGISDIIENEKTGFLVPEKNSRAIAEKIIYALNNPEKVRKIAEQGRKKCVEQFDWQVISSQYERVLSDLIK